MIFDKCYKICCERADGRLVNFAGFRQSSAAYTEYALNLWTLPPIPNTKLFAFGLLENAKELVSGNTIGMYKIFEAECVNPISLLYRLPTGELDCPEVDSILIENFWKSVKTNRCYGIYDTPFGTIGADAIKLVREIT